MKSLILLSLFAFSAAAATPEQVRDANRTIYDPTPFGADNSFKPQAQPLIPNQSADEEGQPTGAAPKAPETPAKPAARSVRQIPIAGAATPGTVTPVETTQKPAPEAPAAAKPAPEAPKISGPITLYAAGNYRLRSREWGPVQLIIPKGKTFEVLARADKGFYLVRYNGKTGYIYESGLDHPLAEAIKAEEGLSALKRYEAAEIAACLAMADSSSAISPDMKDFFQRVQASLETYRDKDPKAEKAPHRVSGNQVNSGKPAPGLTGTVSGTAANAPAPASTSVPLPPVRPTSVAAKGPPLLPKGGSRREYLPNPEDPNSSAIHPDSLKKLSIAADRAARKCRQYANFICKRRGLCGTSCNPARSKGLCKSGVREILQETYGFHLPGGSAAASNTALKRSPKFTQIIGTDCARAPIGAICVYDASHHNFGHIEVKSGANKYCSDYCAARPVSKRNYKVRAIYVPAYKS